MMNDRQSNDRLRTEDVAYAARLAAEQSAWWKRWLDVQAPFRWNLRRLRPGFTLDVGCGMGRNLLHLGGNGVGVDHSPHMVEIARARGLRAFTPAEFQASAFNAAGRFDCLLLSHVVEHMTEPEAVGLLASYLYTLKPGGQVIAITPQEWGYGADPTHVEFMDFAALNRIAGAVKIKPIKQFSFPFPRPFGRLFRWNEFIHVSLKVD